MIHGYSILLLQTVINGHLLRDQKLLINHHQVHWDQEKIQDTGETSVTIVCMYLVEMVIVHLLIMAIVSYLSSIDYNNVIVIVIVYTLY